jgi:hypothetical protein
VIKSRWAREILMVSNSGQDSTSTDSPECAVVVALSLNDRKIFPQVKLDGTGPVVHVCDALPVDLPYAVSL